MTVGDPERDSEEQTIARPRSPAGPSLNEGHAGYGLPSGPPAAGLRRCSAQRMGVAPAGGQGLAGSVGVEAQTCTGAVSQAHATQPIRVRVHPIAGDTEAFGQFARVDEPHRRARCGGGQLREVLGDRVDLVDLEGDEASVPGRQQFYLPCDERRET